jgi:UDP-perosamine 4-acetyltransferase
VSAREVIVIGAGGHAKVVIETLRAQGDRVVGLIGTQGDAAVLGAPTIGTDDDLPRLHAEGLKSAIVAIGDNGRRLTLARRLEGMGFTLVNAVHPHALLSPSVRLGSGIAIMAGVVINADAAIGDHAIVNTRAGIDHDCRIGEAAHIAPGATLAGGVTVGARAFVGAGSAVIPQIEICADAVIGAGASVVRAILEPGVYVGAPARAHSERKGSGS